MLGRIADATRRRSERASLVLDDEVLTHGDVDRMSTLVARGVGGVGLGRGSRIAVLGPNHLLSMVATLGIIRAGATWIPLNPRDSIDAIAGLSRRFRTDMLIYHSDFTDALAQILSEATTITEIVALDDLPGGASPSLLEWAASHDAGATLVEPDPDDLSAVFATGGTTGVAKGVCYSYRTLSAIAGNYVELLDHSDPIFLAAAPLTHVSGRVSLGVMAAGGTTVVLPQFDPGAVLAAIERHRVTTMVLPTTMLNRVLAHPAAGSTDTSSLRRVVGRRFAGAGRVAQAGDQHVRTGHRPELRPDRGPDAHHRDATRRVPRRRSVRPGRADGQLRPTRLASATSER